MVDIAELGNAHIAGYVERLYAELDGAEAFTCRCRTRCGTPVSEAQNPTGSGMQQWAFVGDEDGRPLLEPIELDDCVDVLRAVTGMEQSLIVDRLEEARAGAGAAPFSSGGRTEAAQRAIEIYQPPLLHPSENRVLASASQFLEMHESLSDRLTAAARAAAESPSVHLGAAARVAAESLSDRLTAAARAAAESPSVRFAAAVRAAAESPPDRLTAAARAAAESPSDRLTAAARAAAESSSVHLGAAARVAAESLSDRLSATVREVAEYNLARVALGPFEDLRRSFRIGSIASKTAAALEEQFRLPAVEETGALLGTLGLATRAAMDFQVHGDEVRKAIEATNAPWLNIKDEVRSLAGFVELQDIGHVLNTTPDFGSLSADRLRPYLGDWRASIDWPPEIVTNPFVRSDFYLKRGLDPALTDFPAAAFDRALTVAGIKRPPPPRLDDYDRAGAPPADDEETGLQRNNAAHDHLQRFETQVRRFIDRMMTAALGENWIRHRVDGSMREQWKDKRDKALARGEPEKPLIAYADFTDYEKIIVRKDNWKEVFESVFQRKTSVQESWQRLYPIRVCTMHARIITQDDELFLHSETLRLLRAIGTET